MSSFVASKNTPTADSYPAPSSLLAYSPLTSGGSSPTSAGVGYTRLYR